MSKPEDIDKQQEPKRFKIDSQEKSHEFRKFQETAKCLTFESICINELVYEVNKKIEHIVRRRLILEKKREVTG
jgi:hypothetical protein